MYIKTWDLPYYYYHTIIWNLLLENLLSKYPKYIKCILFGFHYLYSFFHNLFSPIVVSKLWINTYILFVHVFICNMGRPTVLSSEDYCESFDDVICIVFTCCHAKRQHLLNSNYFSSWLPPTWYSIFKNCILEPSSMSKT